MNLAKHLYILILFIIQTISAQTMFTESSYFDEYFVVNELVQEKLNSSQTEINWLQEAGDVFTLNNHQLSAGFNLTFETFLDSGFYVKDMFVYNANISFDIGAFNLIFLFENFLNIDQKEAEILPDPLIVNNTIHQIDYVIDSPYSISLSLVFNF